MFDEQRKTAKIVAELTMFFLSAGADDITSSIKKDGKQGVITFHANYNPEEADKLKELKALEEQRYLLGTCGFRKFRRDQPAAPGGDDGG